MMPEWISVTDRLPPNANDVLVFSDECIDIGYLSPSRKLWIVYSTHGNCVTHWMPLPEPPKEEA